MIGGLDVDQVAQLLGKRPGTVRVLQHRALRRLQAELAKGTCNAMTAYDDPRDRHVPLPVVPRKPNGC